MPTRPCCWSATACARCVTRCMCGGEMPGSRRWSPAMPACSSTSSPGPAGRVRSRNRGSLPQSSSSCSPSRRSDWRHVASTRRGGPGGARDGEAIVVRTKNARALLTESMGLVRYEPQGGDPLGLGGYRELDDRELLTRTIETAVPDAPRQLLQLFGTQRAGDLVLAAAPGADFRGPWEIPEHRASHNSLTAEHIKVPIATNITL